MKVYQPRLDENWQPVPDSHTSPFLDTYTVICPQHGEWCPNGYYEPSELWEMVESGEILCPFCMQAICDE